MAPCLSHSSHSMRNKRYTSTQKPSQGAQTQRKNDGNTSAFEWILSTVSRAESPVVIVSMVRSSPIDEAQAKKLKRLLNNPKISYENVFVNTSANKNQLSIRPPNTGFAKSPNRVNVAYSRAQNLLIVLGNRWAWNGVSVKIKRDNGDIERPRYYQELMRNTIRGGMLDGRNLL